MPEEEDTSIETGEEPGLNIGMEIKILRERKRISGKELAERIGLSQSQMSRLEKGQRRIDAQILHKIARALDVRYLTFLLTTQPTMELFSWNRTCSQRRFSSRLLVLDQRGAQASRGTVHPVVPHPSLTCQVLLAMGFVRPTHLVLDIFRLAPSPNPPLSSSGACLG